eukprot:6203944-Pleurochrysis_carterae.AAC.1
MSTGTFPWKQYAESIGSVSGPVGAPKEAAGTLLLLLRHAACAIGVYVPGPGVSALREGGLTIVPGPRPPKATVFGRSCVMATTGLYIGPGEKDFCGCCEAGSTSPR